MTPKEKKFSVGDDETSLELDKIDPCEPIAPEEDRAYRIAQIAAMILPHVDTPQAAVKSAQKLFALSLSGEIDKHLHRSYDPAPVPEEEEGQRETMPIKKAIKQIVSSNTTRGKTHEEKFIERFKSDRFEASLVPYILGRKELSVSDIEGLKKEYDVWWKHQKQNANQKNGARTKKK
jgi:hypothetical protein